jgi:ubiquitin carboxyl-terminal hydrolase 34
VPDNLIFHLKRFDFDMITMLRSKINDEFQFPLHIDMAPYTVEHLADPDQPIEPDMFELVGVLVHTGTAESGHYYSYTLERPSPGGEASWVEFNDSEVSRFDPASISDNCFGGLQPPQYVNGNAKVKAWNAYMLFYQRVSTIEISKSKYKPSKPDTPVHVAVPVSAQNHISMDNELLIRTYCLLDPQYAFFVHKLLQRWSEMPFGDNKTRAERLAINVGMDTIEQLVTRTKELQGHQEIYHDLVDMIDASPSAAQSALRWVCDRQTSMRNLMTKTPLQEVRGKLISLINHALKHLHVLSTDPNTEGDDQSSWRIEFDAALQNIVSLLAELWPHVQAIPRVWEDYFGFFSKLCYYGPSAVRILLEQGLLVNCLQILWIDSEDKKGLQIQYANYVRLMEKGRRFPYLSLLAMCLILIKHIDLSVGPSPNGEERRFLTETGKFSARESELDLIQPLDEDGSLSILMKIFKHWTVSRTQTARLILAALLDGEPEAGLLHAIHKSLENGLRIDPAIHCTPFLEAAVTFCQYCPDATLVRDIITFIANGVETIDSSGGQEHMDFFTRICGITNQRLNMDSRAFTELSLSHLPAYAPTLLIDREESVRQSMQSILNEVFVGDKDEATDRPDIPQNGEENEQEEGGNILYNTMREERSIIGRRLQKACVERLTTAFVKDPIRPVDARQLECIISVINYCISTFYGDSEEDENEVKKTRGTFE